MNTEKIPSILTFIPARSGSKGLKEKCIRNLGGTPLLARTVLTAKKACLKSRIIVSTDDPVFAEIAEEYGAEVPFLRPPELSTDTSSVMDAVSHLLQKLKEDENYSPDYIMLLQPTSPFLIPSDIDKASELIFSSPEAKSVVSVCETEVKPDWLRTISDVGYLEHIAGLVPRDHTARQLLKDSYRLNGALYIVRNEVFMEEHTFLPEKTIAYVMPQSRSVDIDTEFDLKTAEFLLSEMDDLQ